MTLRRTRLGLALGLLATLAGAACTSDEALAAAGVGETAPAFDLPKVDGSGKIALASQLAEANVVLVWISPACPYSRACDARFEALHQAIGKLGFRVIGINSNKTENPAGLHEYAKKMGWTFPIVYDEGNAVADAYGATKTPEVVMIDKASKVRYRGAIDDNVQKAAEVKTRYVEDAAAAIAAGKEPAVTTTKPMGCGIKRR